MKAKNAGLPKNGLRGPKLPARIGHMPLAGKTPIGSLIPC